MKFFHLSDLHIGKHLHHYNLKEDQEAVLAQVVEYARSERPDCIVIAGDIYDKAAPSAEAVSVFDGFLTELAGIEPVIPILIISGNHDSAQRLDFASGILQKQAVHIAGMPPVTVDDRIKKVVLEDAYGDVNFYMLPFVKPGYVRNVFPEEAIESYDVAVKRLIEREEVDGRQRNVLISHQFYTAGGERPMECESESITVGGLDNVDVEAVKVFDYVALGHIHGPQPMGAPWIRYCGTPMKYSVSESSHVKSVTVVTLNEKGSVPVIETLPLKPLYDVRKLEGELKDILKEWESEGAGTCSGDEEVKVSEGYEKCQDYVSVTLTDETELYKPKEELGSCFERILEVKVDNSRTRAVLEGMEDVRLVTDPLKVFGEFFQEMQGRSMSEEEMNILQGVIMKVKEGDED